ncbi:hypothetical protein M3Y99_01717100 [Aphelenchoides fujianensis]|nr:hypothetical protein M3Y99_01717100 [Aphelenchoides fujianensis]
MIGGYLLAAPRSFLLVSSIKRRRSCDGSYEIHDLTDNPLVRFGRVKLNFLDQNKSPSCAEAGDGKLIYGGFLQYAGFVEVVRGIKNTTKSLHSRLTLYLNSVPVVDWRTGFYCKDGHSTSKHVKDEWCHHELSAPLCTTRIPYPIPYPGWWKCEFFFNVSPWIFRVVVADDEGNEVANFGNQGIDDMLATCA